MRSALNLTIVFLGAAAAVASAAVAEASAGLADEFDHGRSALSLIQHQARSDPAGTDAKSNLPEVDAVLARASVAAEAFAKQAEAMRDNMAERQEATKQELARKKAMYVVELENQQAKLSRISDYNEQLRQNISHEEHLVSLAQKRADQVDKVNQLVRNAIVGLQPKVEAVRDFIADSVRLARTQNADDLKVLSTQFPQMDLEHFLTVARQQLKAGSGDGQTALLQEGAPTAIGQRQAPPPSQQNPEKLVQGLSNSVARLAQAETKGDNELKLAFESSFSGGEEKQVKLEQESRELEEALRSAQGKLRDVLRAETQLRGTSQSLQQPLHGLDAFAKKLEAVAKTALEKAGEDDEQNHVA